MAGGLLAPGLAGAVAGHVISASIASRRTFDEAVTAFEAGLCGFSGME